MGRPQPSPIDHLFTTPRGISDVMPPPHPDVNVGEYPQHIK